jgi:hypothetical protein
MTATFPHRADCCPCHFLLQNIALEQSANNSAPGECSMATKAIPQTTNVNTIRNGLLPTPPMPDGLPKANLTDNARQVLMKRYVRRGDDGKPAETVEEKSKSSGKLTFRSVRSSTIIYYPVRNFFRTLQHLPARALRSDSSRLVSYSQSPTIWDATPQVSFRLCAMPH